MTFAPSIRMHHATRAKAERLAALLVAEYPRLSLVATEGDEIDHETYEFELDGFEVQVDEDDVVFASSKVPELADIIDACADQGIDPTTDDEDDDERSGSVVKEVYRKRYQTESTNGQTCGDWLAERLVDDTTDGAGKLCIEDLTGIFQLNGLDMTAKWAVARHAQTNGWRGRYRMSGRIVLEKVVALRGVYIGPMGIDVNPPSEWLYDMRAKHAKWIAKQEKAQ